MPEDGLPAWLRDQLDRRGWNAKEFAHRLGKDQAMVSRWLHGERRPNPASCAGIAVTLAADVDQVLTLAGHRPPAATDDPLRADLLDRLRRVPLSPERAAVIRAVLDAMLHGNQDGDAT